MVRDCMCCDLMTGCKLAAIYTIIIGLLDAIFIIAFNFLGHLDYAMLHIITLSAAFFLILGGIILYVSIYRRQESGLLVYLIIAVLYAFIRGTMIIMSIYWLCVYDNDWDIQKPHAGIIVRLILHIIGVILDSWAITSVLSLFRYVKHPEQLQKI
ncbi:uncharacterized protein LOC129598400 [Paramacrobiotus metropolitanus]|uniref:uncharacterized protein LOC129598400 n=1 Tax=Paramacrobiotus metropolitanus TaxID=2943436 RepID=UPI002445FFC4|nr:uncharacterized protein LOC129598400 [Paramacrobiotus metropolitanus]